MIYADLAEILMRRGNHVFWHAVATHRTRDLEADLRASVPDSVSMSWVNCKSLPVDANGDLVTSRLNLGGDVVALSDVDFLLDVRTGQSLLRQLRPPSMRVLDRGGRLLVVAKRPQSDFPLIDGSNIVHDGLPAHLRPLPDEGFGAYHVLQGLSARQRQRVLANAKGLRGVLSQIGTRIERDESGAVISCPAQPAQDRILQDVAADALVEMGDEVVGTVLSLMDTSGRIVPVNDVPEMVFSRLKWAGLARLDRATDRFSLLPGLSGDLARATIGLADLKISRSGLWDSVARNVFTIERCVRHLVARRLADDSDGGRRWLTTHEAAIDRNWRQDYERENALNDQGPVAPLSYVNLSDLLTIAQELSRGRHVGGLSSARWRELADDVIPVRNRIGHMRLPSAADREVIRLWCRSLLRACESV